MSSDLAGLIERVSLTISVVILIAAIVSSVYIWHVYRQRRDQALFLDWMVRAAYRIALAAIIGVSYLVLVALGAGFGRPWGGIIIQVAFCLPLTVVVSMAWLWWKERRVK